MDIDTKEFSGFIDEMTTILNKMRQKIDEVEEPELTDLFSDIQTQNEQKEKKCVNKTYLKHNFEIVFYDGTRIMYPCMKLLEQESGMNLSSSERSDSVQELAKVRHMKYAKYFESKGRRILKTIHFGTDGKTYVTDSSLNITQE